MAVITKTSKGAALTAAEMDGNWTELIGLLTRLGTFTASQTPGANQIPVTGSDSAVNLPGSCTIYGNLLMTSTDGTTYRYLDIKRSVGAVVYDALVDIDSGNGNTRFIHLKGGVTDATLSLGASGCFVSVPVIASAGVKYGAGTVAMTAYDEGVWTPAVAGATTPGTNTYAIRSGYYTRVGRLVTIFCQVTLATKDVAMAGEVRITGLPFAVVGGVYGTAAFRSFSGINLTSGYTQLAGSLDQGGTVIRLIQSGSGVSQNVVDSTAIASNASMILSGTYQV